MSDDDSCHDAQSHADADADADGGSSSESEAELDDHPLLGGDPAGVYAPYLHLRQEQQREESSMVRLPPRVIGSWKDNHVDKTGFCKCRKSNCLKLYCDCFSAGVHCHVKCSCTSCHNTNRNPQHVEERQKAIMSVLKRDPHAFRPKVTEIPDMAASAAVALARASGGTVDDASSSTATTKGCNCKKSLCLKKYCECFGASMHCTESCRCLECQNVQENMNLKHFETKQRSKAARRQAILEGSSHSLPAPGEHAQQAAAAAIYGGATGTDATSANNGLPPSSFAIPMMLNQNGNESLFPAISFGMARGKRNRKADGEPSASGESRPEQHSVLGANGNQGHSTSNGNIVSIQPAAADDGRTNVERYWERQVKRVRATFDGVRDELSKEDGPENGPSGKELDEWKARFEGSVLYKTVNQDLHHVMALMKQAEQNASEMIGREEQKRDRILSKEEKSLLECTEELEPTIVDLEFGPPSPQKTPQPRENAGSKSKAENDDNDRLSLLTCDEELEGPESANIPSESAPRNLTIALAQDVALIRGLTQIVRRQTLEMTRRRMANTEQVEN